MNGKQFKNNVFAPTKKTQKNLSKIFFLSFQSMMKRLKHGSLVFCCFLALLWLYDYLSNTFPSSENTSVIQEQDTKLDVGPKDSIEKYLDEILEYLFKLTSFRKEISGVYCPSSLLLSFVYLQLIKHCLSHFLCHDQQCLEVL